MSAADPSSLRPVGATEQSWCRAVPGGTGITVLALLLSKSPDLFILKTAINNLQNSHPILRSRLRHLIATQSFSFAFPEESPALEVECYDLESTLKIVQYRDSGLPAFQTIIEHEINVNPWEDVSKLSSVDGIGVFYAKAYEVEGGRTVVALKLHTAACDRAAAVVVLKELMEMMNGGGAEMEIERNVEVKMGIEEYIPRGKGNKPFWARGVDMLGYSFNSFRLNNIDFVDPDSPRRSSEIVRFRLDPVDTSGLLEGCRKRGIKLCGVVAAAGLMAARQCKGVPEGQWEKFAVVTLTDCRPILQPPLTSHDIGFYHSAILNTHDINGTERPWELAKKIYSSFLEAKILNKHFTDMADLNSLMCKAIDNPSLTPSSSLRTSFISMFEDVVVDQTTDMDLQHMGVEDCMGCSSVHGVGPTLALFDTIRDGRLDLTCVYPAPLHSREQMQELVVRMKRILVENCC